MARFVLVASPFVGAVSWQATAAQLSSAIVADYRPLEGPDWYETVARRIADQAGGGVWIAVVHSGAGAFVPALAETAYERLSGFIFVDAVLPYPGKTCLENAPDWLRQAMRRLKQPDGALAPWNRWFPQDPLPRLLADETDRAAFEADQPRTPFAFLEALSRPSSAWERLPAAYLQLSKGYGAAADTAASRGWPVRRVQRHHLAMTSHPEETAALIDELAQALTCQ